MANISKKADRITYSRLDKTLCALGFVRKETKDFTAYREKKHGALIVLPHRGADSEVGDPHLVTVRNTVTGKGIASLDRFQTLLVGLHVKSAASRLRSRALRHSDAYAKPRKSGSTGHDQKSTPVKKTYKKSGTKKHSSSALSG